jgi:PKD repeat protein
MKKINSLVFLLVVILSANAQVASPQQLRKHLLNSDGSRSIGDTLMYMPLVDIYINATDNAGFSVTMEDVDGLSPFNPGYAYDFGVYFSTDTIPSASGIGNAEFYHPWENPLTDSSFFWAATSYFTPPGIADNWLMFGPLTIPPHGATLIWYDKTQRYRDGYEVLVTTSTVPGASQTYSDFYDPAIFSEADDSVPSATYAQDTTWEYKSVVIPASYSGQLISIAFHHTATDMDILFLDEITVVEGAISTCDADFTIVQDSTNLFNYTVYNNSSSGGAYSYLWDFGDSTTSTLQYPTHNYSWSGPFQLCVTVTDTSGCYDMHCDSLNAGHASVGLTLTVVPPMITGVKEIKPVNGLTFYPNPASSNTTISYNINEEAIVELSVFDLIGNSVMLIDKGSKQPGNHQLTWDANGLSSGMYLLQLRTGDQLTTKKIIITK